MNTPKQIAESYAAAGRDKVTAPVGRMLLLAVLAGAFIAFAGVASVIGSALAGKLAGACIFPAGLAMVILAGSELFTGNNLLVIPLLERRITVRQLLTAWLVVYLGNLIGAVLVAALAVAGGTFDSCYDALIATAAGKTSLSFGTALVRGVLCNVLVCVAVWMAMAATDPAGKILALYGPIMVFVLCGFEHCVANMFYIPAGILSLARYGVTQEGLTWGTFLWKNLLPVTLGNMLGGCGLGVALWGLHLRPGKKARQTT